MQGITCAYNNIPNKTTLNTNTGSAMQGITCAHNNRPNKTTLNTNTRFYHARNHVCP